MGDVLAPPRSPFAEDTTSCLHCGLPVGGSRTGFCCVGCRAVFGLLHGEHLDRFYDLRGRRGMPVPAMRAARRDTKWLEAVEAQVRSSTGPARVVLDVQGLHCVGCVWLVEEMFSRAPGGQQVIVNPSLGRVDLIVRPDFDLRSFVAAVERFGYLFGPPVKRSPRGSRDLLVRLGVCAAISMNSMIFAIPTYAGLDCGPVFRLFTTLNLVLGAAAVAVGGTVFFRSAWRALRHHMLHLDLPIALGIALAFAGSVHSFFFRGSESSYFDTLDVFITLMLLGRWLQERAVERNRAWLLASDGTDGLLARRLRQGCVEMVRCAELCAGDDFSSCRATWCRSTPASCATTARSRSTGSSVRAGHALTLLEPSFPRVPSRAATKRGSCARRRASTRRPCGSCSAHPSLRPNSRGRPRGSSGSRGSTWWAS